jgi:hypothetical protein
MSKQAQRAWRERRDRGEMICPVTVAEETVDLLVRHGLVHEEDRKNRLIVGRAISRLRFRIADDPVE